VRSVSPGEHSDPVSYLKESCPNVRMVACETLSNDLLAMN
jgi:hypothetical protein